MKVERVMWETLERYARDTINLKRTAAGNSPTARPMDPAPGVAPKDSSTTITPNQLPNHSRHRGKNSID
jgi:hypothetical protein